MRRKLLLTVLLFCYSAIWIHAQEINVYSIIELMNDNTAVNNPRQDLNGDDCALLKIEAPGLDGLVFKGSVVGDIEQKSDVYYVYVAAGTKRLNFQHVRFLPGTIDFSSAGVLISGNATYGVLLEASKKQESPFGSLTVTSSLDGCTAFLDGMDIGEAPVFLTQVEPGVHKISMSKTFYETSEVSVTVVAGENADVNFSLKVIPMVDLGLSVKWATCNIGATAPEGYGDYYAWGETETKQDFTMSSYAFSVKSKQWIYSGGSKVYPLIMNKYCVEEGVDEIIDGKDTLEEPDDVARATLGKEWRMPTAAEWEELMEQCDWEWTTLNGVNGYKVTSRKRGFTDRYIFLPASGYYSDLKVITSRGSVGNYWSSSLNKKHSPSASQLSFDNEGCEKVNSDRWIGRTVRPVYGGKSTAKRFSFR